MSPMWKVVQNTNASISTKVKWTITDLSNYLYEVAFVLVRFRFVDHPSYITLANGLRIGYDIATNTRKFTTPWIPNRRDS